MVLEIKQVKKDQAKKKPEIIKESYRLYTSWGQRYFKSFCCYSTKRVNSNWSMELPWYALCWKTR